MVKPKRKNLKPDSNILRPSFTGVRAGGAGGAAAPPVAKIFGQNACDSGKSTWDIIFID